MQTRKKRSPSPRSSPPRPPRRGMSVGPLFAIFCSVGAFESSPAFQRRVKATEELVPKGRLKHSSQPSLRDWSFDHREPGVETPGYFRMSLRDERHRRTRAFTLIELILVMVMMLAILSVVAPSLSKFFKGRNLDSEARRMVALTR